MSTWRLTNLGTETAETCADGCISRRMENGGESDNQVWTDARRGEWSSRCVECGADIRTQRPGAVYTCDRCHGQSE
ncbi:hypothetical protein [Alicyclobacillus macrosporangiidus]|jgi:hypothetical protein|uniref:Uncharacterized protein n=1 Tax=Alicyclobacillus macrosporangiidus TaxID=392015 RepID=A0A1I7GVU9_9BACL|nr:hypothetical protein [Alicyclobacillus macrosporangiidus]SFU52551.1 hypothetical protein SAMN05421543_10392 [Alicyclobacillus macrosporangiidus]